jgi:hypothetical protein
MVQHQAVMGLVIQSYGSNYQAGSGVVGSGVVDLLGDHTNL